jgi:twinkle protein
MDLLNFVKKHLGEHKVKGHEITIKKCPYCGREKYKFGISEEKGLFQCFSGSCRKTGQVSQLYEKYNEEYNLKFKNPKSDMLQYARPTNNAIIEYFKTRGISEKTIKQNFFDVMSTINKEISFIYRKKFEVHSVKIRNIKEKKFTGRKYKEFTLWKLDYCDTDLPLIIVEGEIDQLSFEEQGINNVVSVPSGANSLEWIDTDFEEIEKFKTIILGLDNDKAGIECAKKIIKRLPDEAEIKIINYGNYKDANEIHLSGNNLQSYIECSKVIDEDYRIKMFEIQEGNEIRFSTGIPALNRKTGGIRTGELNIWTGKAGSGKSSILNQVMLNVMNSNNKCLIYTPELADGQYKEWTCRQLLTKSEGCFDKKYCDIRERDIFTIKKHISEKMSLWVDKHLINISNNKKLSDKEILRIIKREIKKNNIKFIVIDNLMKVIFEEENATNELKLHKDFINKLSELCKLYNISINLVAHPKKHNELEPDQYDIAGTANIPNLVDNIFYVRRIKKTDFEKDLKNKEEEYNAKGIKTLIMLLKSRDGENIGEWQEFCFNINKKTIYNFDEGEKTIPSWMEEKKENEDLPEIFRGL